jgi:nucleoside-diphosphate-sugar epimerase
MLFVFGLGYSAGAFARAWRAQGHRVVATTRDPAGTGTGGNSDGIERIRFDARGDIAPLLPVLSRATHVVVSIPPLEPGEPMGACDPVAARFGDALAAARRLQWLAYLSSTGVYGDHGGAWVRETDPCRPHTAQAQARAAAERAWLALWRARGVPVHVLRLAGIYGPGRSAIDLLRRGAARRIDKPGHVFSRIHVDDIVAVLAASAARPRPGAIYNVADDVPAPHAEIVAHAAMLLGLAPPPLEPYDPDRVAPAARGFYAASRRICNARIKHELAVALKYPDYRVGLAACSAAQKSG